MTMDFPPMPPHDQLRIDDGDLVFRPAEPEDAPAIYQLMSQPEVPFMLDEDRPESLERLEQALGYVFARDEAREPTRVIFYVIELDGEVIGVFKTYFQMLDKNGGREGLLLRSAMWLAYFSPEFIRQGMARRFKFGRVEEVIEEAYVRHFGIEQMTAWIDDSNENARAMVTAYGFEGPLNHNQKDGLGFYRRKTRSYD